jgi:hypothetical protein
LMEKTREPGETTENPTKHVNRFTWKLLLFCSSHYYIKSVWKVQEGITYGI